MVKRTVEWTETAKKQRRIVLRYWVEKNKSTLYSEKLIEKINHRIEAILKSPEIYKKADFPKTRVSAMGHYSIFYQITNKKIIITAFWDNRQDPKKLYQLLRD